MARCERCDACQSMWDLEPCVHCGFPGEDPRDAQTIENDNWDMYHRLINEHMNSLSSDQMAKVLDNLWTIVYD